MENRSKIANAPQPTFIQVVDLNLNVPEYLHKPLTNIIKNASAGTKNKSPKLPLPDITLGLKVINLPNK